MHAGALESLCRACNRPRATRAAFLVYECRTIVAGDSERSFIFFWPHNRNEHFVHFYARHSPLNLTTRVLAATSVELASFSYYLSI